MAAITNDCLKIDGISEKYLIVEFNMKNQPNEHGHAAIRIRMYGDGKGKNLLKSLESKIVTVKSTAEENSGVIFKGYIQSCSVSPQIDGELVDICLITTTIKADNCYKNCSFQKKTLKYSEVVSNTMRSGVCNYIDSRMKNEQIEKPVIRYRETEWEFIRRLSSRYYLPVISDETADRPTVSIEIGRAHV